MIAMCKSGCPIWTNQAQNEDFGLREMQGRIEDYIARINNIQDSFSSKFTSSTTITPNDWGGGLLAWDGRLSDVGPGMTDSGIPGSTSAFSASVPTDFIALMMGGGTLGEDVWAEMRRIMNKPPTGLGGINPNEYAALAFTFGRMGAPADQGRFLTYLADEVDLTNLYLSHLGADRSNRAWTFCPYKVGTIYRLMGEQADYDLAELTRIRGNSVGTLTNNTYNTLDAARRLNMQNMSILSLVASLTQEYDFDHPAGHVNVTNAQRVVLHNDRGITIAAGRTINAPDLPSIRVMRVGDEELGGGGAVSLQITTASLWTTGPSPSGGIPTGSLILGGGEITQNFRVTNGLEGHESQGVASQNARNFINQNYGTSTGVVAAGFERVVSRAIGGVADRVIGPAFIPLSFLWDYNTAEFQRQQSHANQLAHIDATDIGHMASVLELNTVIITEQGSAQQMFFFWESSQTQRKIQENSSRIGNISIDDIRQDPMGVHSSLVGN